MLIFETNMRYLKYSGKDILQFTLRYLFILEPLLSLLVILHKLFSDISILIPHFYLDYSTVLYGNPQKTVSTA